MTITDPAVLAAAKQLKAYMDNADPAEAARIYAEKKSQFGFTDADFDQAAGGLIGASNPAAKTAFDPAAMGLEKLVMDSYTPSSPETGEASREGTQTGWYKYLGDRKQQQYDMEGNPTRIFENPGIGEQMLDLGKKVAPLAIAAVTMGGFAGAGPLGNLLGGGGAGGFTAAEIAGSSAMTEAFIPAAEAFTSTSTLGTVAENIAQQTFRAAEMNFANTVAGKAAIESTTAGLYNIVTNGIRNSTAYISEALGIKDTGLLNDLKNVLSIGGKVGAGTSLFDYLMKGLQGGMNNSAAADSQRIENQGRVDVANINATSALDVQKLKDQQYQDANKRYSSSVSGINYGLINSTPKPLTRNDGSRVFSGNGLINRG